MQNYLFGGWVLQYNMNDQISFGGELYAQGTTTTTRHPPEQDTGAYSLINVGGSYAFTDDVSFLLSLGHSMTGPKQWVGYVGIYYLLNTR
ncbi:MAG: hypothetical protein H0W64_07310 [Gammaproteobacteria bacterium]|nr:hypothetical protein [Gammaproteobacteria bacterium]